MAQLTPQWRVGGQCVLRWLILLSEKAWIATVRRDLVQLTMANFLAAQWLAHDACLRCHKLCSGLGLLLLDSFVVLDLAAVVALEHLVAASSAHTDCADVVIAQVSLHARVLLRGHVPADTSNVIKSALIGSGATAVAWRR